MKQSLNFESSFAGLSNLISTLLSSNGCPWDKKQSLKDLQRYFIEESYELLEAIDLEDNENIKEELGDVTFNICFMMHLTKNLFQFGQDEIFGDLIKKIINRHPHVFKEVNENIKVNEIMSNWDDIKGEERGAKFIFESNSPRLLPALVNSLNIQEKAARFGFDWENINDVEGQLKGELEEFNKASNDLEKELEMGDVFFSMVNLARWNNIDPEASLRKANQRFYRRLIEVERICNERKIDIRSLNINERDDFWEEAKNNLRN
ncbi:MAG: nucleoside triphosphate pyrophosphohydrolase [SAR202 cluster bacterium]|nr:nucleoside triphosphate pyrophosphohydrolase [SAR202 cluster bacterium]|tara:strand:+ start:7866 stop:8654 length:789 start_codon:yes stop_codon:yes gene_type:complete